MNTLYDNLIVVDIECFPPPSEFDERRDYSATDNVIKFCIEAIEASQPLIIVYPDSTLNGDYHSAFQSLKDAVDFYSAREDSLPVTLDLLSACLKSFNQLYPRPLSKSELSKNFGNLPYIKGIAPSLLITPNGCDFAGLFDEYGVLMPLSEIVIDEDYAATKSWLALEIKKRTSETTQIAEQASNQLSMLLKQPRLLR